MRKDQFWLLFNKRPIPVKANPQGNIILYLFKINVSKFECGYVKPLLGSGSSVLLQLSNCSRYLVCRWWGEQGSGVALTASAMRNGSSGGAGLLNCSWKWSFHLWSWSVSSQRGDPSLAVTGGSLDAVRPVSVRMVR